MYNTQDNNDKKASTIDLQKIIISIIMINALTACGNGSNETSQKPTVQNQTAQQQSTANAIDTDKDGVYDELDAEPKNPWIAGKVVVTTMEHSQKSEDTIGFDAKGRETYVSSIDAQGKPTSTIWKQYNAKGDVTLYKEDNNGDGKPNKTIKTDYHSNGKQKQVENINQNNQIIERKIYNQKGVLIREEKDKNNDGQIDWVVIHTYDNNGKHLKSTTDKNGDGKIDLTRISTYDINGNNISVYNEDVDGNRTYKTKKTYHSNGQLNKEIIYINAGQTTTNEYDSNGNQTLKKYESDSFNDFYKYEYNEHNIKTKELKLKTDGSIERATYNTTNATGKLITKIEQDWNGDGVIDNTTIQTFNALGKITKSETSGSHPEEIQRKSKMDRYQTKTTYTYDDSGYLIEKYHTTDDDLTKKGQMDNGIHYERWQYDENDRKVYHETYSGGFDRRFEKFTYDANGNMLSYENKSYCQTNVERYCTQKYEYKYNAQNKMTEDKKVYDNGDIEYKNSWQYADDGTLLEHKKQSPGGYETIYRYNDKGHPIEVIFLQNGDKYYYKRTFAYTGTVVKAAKVIVDKKIKATND